MKKSLFTFLVLIITLFNFYLGEIAMSSEQIKYKNPLTVYKVADPFILKYNNKYYLYATSERGAGMSGGFEVWESPDLVNFEYKGFAYKSNEKSWGFDSFWAPEVLYYNGKFYLFYSAAGMIDGNKTLRICLAESNSPLGPFVDIKAPLFDFGYAAIDAHPFVDNGQVYLYYSRDCSENPTSDIYVVKLSKDLKNTIGEAKFLLTPSQSWEIGAKWNEGPFVVKHNNKYYLFYSANFYASPDYSVGYAVSNNPLGPFIKAKENPILKKNSFVTGPGHNSVVKSPDDREYFIVYHTQMIKEGTYLRQLAIDRLLFTKDGKVKVIGPTYTPQPLPSGSKVPKLASSDNFNSTKLDRSKWFIIGQNNISLTAKKGNLRIKTYQTNLQNIKNDNLDVSNIIIQYTNDLNFSIETSLSPLQKSYGDRAGLIIFQDYDNYIELVRIDGDEKTYIEFYYCLKGTIFSKKIEISNSSKNIALKIEKKANKYTSMYKCDNNKKWTNIAEYAGSNFDITRVGITAYSPMSTDSIYDFDYFNYIRIVK